MIDNSTLNTTVTTPSPARPRAADPVPAPVTRGDSFGGNFGRSRGLFTRLDRIALGAIGGIILLIALTIVVGDRVGVVIDRVSPLGAGARSTSPLTVHFSETMNRDLVQARFRVQADTAPGTPVPGAFTWGGGRQMVFHPVNALTPGTTYTAVLEPGAQSEAGRPVLSEYRYSFTVRSPRVAYLYPADRLPQNIWVADPTDPASAQQLTNSPTSIYDFAVSPDGSQIAFSEKNTDGTSNIKLLTLDTGALVQVTNCPDSDCTTPVWRPDGRVIAYERMDFNSGMDNIGQSPTRLWLIDLTTMSATTPATNRPLFEDSQYLGHTAQWSADGTRIAFYNPSSQGEILVYDFPTGSLTSVPSTAGQSGAFSPDGQQLVYPEIVIQEPGGARSYLRRANLETGEVVYLSQPGEATDDRRAAWRPDGEQLAVARTTEDTGRGFQIYLVDPTDGAAQPLTTDTRYSNMLFYWDATGTQLVVQRFPELDANGQPNNLGLPEIWTINAQTGEGTFIAENGYVPRWIP